MTLKNYKSQILKDPRAKKLNFEPDGGKHSVYRITHKIKLEHYYGSKSNAKILGEGYISSSTDEDFIQDQKSNPQNFKYKIIKTYDNSADKMIHESYLHYKFDVKVNESFYNKSNQTPFGFDRSGVKSPFSEDHIKNLKLAARGKVLSKEHKEKISKSGRGVSGIKKGFTMKEENKKAKGGGNNRGVKNNTAKRIGIFNPDGEMKFLCEGNFFKICEEYELPTNAFNISFKNGTKLYQQRIPQTPEYAKYKGWYARIIT